MSGGDDVRFFLPYIISREEPVAMKRALIGILLFLHLSFFCFAGTCVLLDLVSVDDVLSQPITGFRVSDSPTTGPPLRDPDMEWVENSLTSMTLQEKVGQI